MSSDAGKKGNESFGIPCAIVEDLEHVAKLVFPLPMEGMMLLSKLPSKSDYTWIATEVEVPPEYGHISHFRAADSFNALIKMLRAREREVKAKEPNVALFMDVDGFLEEQAEASRLFVFYKECQRRRSAKECEKEYKDRGCRTCEYDGEPSREHVYEDLMPSFTPVIAWSSFVTSEYGDMAKLGRPRGRGYSVLRQNLMDAEIKAEMITCVSENGQMLTRLFEAGGGEHVFAPGRDIAEIGFTYL